MKNFLDRLNLRPPERRLLVVVSAIVFLVLNYSFIWPRFKDFRIGQRSLAAARKTLDNYRNEKLHLPDYQAKLEKLKGEGSDVLPADQAIHFTRMIQELARSNHIDPSYWGQAVAAKGIAANTNYFEELKMPIRVTTGEQELVDFLYNLGAGNSMVRVRDMTLIPGQMDQRAGGPTNLNVTLTLAASYQKKNPIAPKPDGKPKPDTRAPAGSTR
jgi:hypothetical protein